MKKVIRAFKTDEKQKSKKKNPKNKNKTKTTKKPDYQRTEKSFREKMFGIL